MKQKLEFLYEIFSGGAKQYAPFSIKMFGSHHVPSERLTMSKFITEKCSIWNGKWLKITPSHHGRGS